MSDVDTAEETDIHTEQPEDTKNDVDEKSIKKHEINMDEQFVDIPLEEADDSMEEESSTDLLSVEAVINERILRNAEDQMDRLYSELRSYTRKCWVMSYFYRIMNISLTLLVISTACVVGVLSALEGTPPIITIMSFVIIFFKTFSLVFKFGERAYDKRKLQLSVEMLKDKIMDDSSLYSDGDVLLAFCRKIRKDFRTIQIQSNSKGQNMVTTSEIISANMS